MTTTETLKKKIRHVPDFPKAGILFYDITTLLRDAAGFRMAIDSLVAPFKNSNVELVVGDRLGAGFVPVRKVGKLPHKTRRATYALEYGTDSLEIHDDAIVEGQR